MSGMWWASELFSRVMLYLQYSPLSLAGPSNFIAFIAWSKKPVCKCLFHLLRCRHFWESYIVKWAGRFGWWWCILPGLGDSCSTPSVMAPVGRCVLALVFVCVCVCVLLYAANDYQESVPTGARAGACRRSCCSPASLQLWGWVSSGSHFEMSLKFKALSYCDFWIDRKSVV